MRKTLILLSLLTCLSACKTEEPASITKPDITRDDFLKEFRATLTDMEVKSVTFPSNGKTSWEKGDQVLVDNGNDTAVFTYNASRGVFVTERDDFASAEAYTAVFPATAFLEKSENGNPMISIPCEQKLYPNYIKDLVMAGKAGRDAEFAFQNLFSVVKIEFPADKVSPAYGKNLKKVEFSATDAIVAGNAEISNGALAFMDSSIKTVSFDCGENLVSVDAPICVAIPAQEYKNGFAFRFTFQDNSTLELSSKEDVTTRADEVNLQHLLTPWVAFSGGDGSADDPYIINGIADFREFIQKCASDPEFLSKSYLQTADLDLGKDWVFKPVGTEESPFTGTYDGSGHSLRGAGYLTDQSGQPVAMFRYTDGATVRNIKLLDWDMFSRAQYLGGLAGIARNTTFENCEWNGKLQQLAKSLMADYSSDKITENKDFGFTGGIAAFAEDCTFANCIIDGQISSSGKCVGGITGYARKSRITKCSTTSVSEIHTPVTCAGSITGAMTQNSTVSECTASGMVAALEYCGGVVGYLQSGTVEKCAVSSCAMISGKSGYIGGIAGTMASKNAETASIDRCTVYSDVTGAYAVGGIAGILNGNDSGGIVTITNSSFKGGTLSATGSYNKKYSLSGGIVGWIDHTSKVVIENCMTAPGCIKTAYAQGADSDTMGGSGGIFGYNHNTGNTEVSNCYTAAGIGNLMHRGGAVTSFPGFTLWGLVAGRNNVEIRETTAKIYYNSDSGRGIAPTEKNANHEGVTSVQMTDGTLLNKLNAGISSLQLNSTIIMSGWTAGTDGYPKLECEITDPQPRDNTAKRVSIIGDSISSFGGYIPTGYLHHYPCSDGSVTRVEQTYWWQLIYDKMSNARLDINMSFSGTCVAATKADDKESFIARYIQLGSIGNPDIVIIHGGTNDWAARHSLYPGASVDCKSDKAPDADVLESLFARAEAARTREEIEALPHGDFCSAYVKLICLIKQQYPKTKIVCIIGDRTSLSVEKSIIAIADHYDNVKYVDLYAVNGFNDQTYMPKHDYNGSNQDSACHPGRKAMEFISDKIYNELGAWLEK